MSLENFRNNWEMYKIEQGLDSLPIIEIMALPDEKTTPRFNSRLQLVTNIFLFITLMICCTGG